MKKLLLFLALYLPFQIALNPAEGIDLASIRALILLLFAFWLLSGLKNKKIIIRKNWQTAFIASFLFLNVFSVIMARNTDWSLRKLMFLFSIFPLYFVLSGNVRKKETVLKLVNNLLLSGVAVAALGIVQFFAQFIAGLNTVYEFWAKNIIPIFLGRSFSEAVLASPSWLVNIGGHTYLRATATFPDPHMFSFYLGLLIPLALGMLLTAKRGKFLLSLSLAVLLLADILTFSRGGYLGLSAGIISLAVIFRDKLDVKYRLVSITLVFLTIATLAVSNPVSQRFFSILDLKEGSNQGRIETWKQAIGVIVSNPLLGVGIGNYPLEIKPTTDYREPIYAHSAYLDVAAETGVVNALAWAALLFFAWLAFWKKGRQDIFFLTGSASIMIFAVHSLVETGIYSPVVLALLLIIISFSSFAQTNEEVI